MYRSKKANRVPFKYCFPNSREWLRITMRYKISTFEATFLGIQTSFLRRENMLIICISIERFKFKLFSNRIFNEIRKKVRKSKLKWHFKWTDQNILLWLVSVLHLSRRMLYFLNYKIFSFWSQHFSVSFLVSVKFFVLSFCTLMIFLQFVFNLSILNCILNLSQKVYENAYMVDS